MKWNEGRTTTCKKRDQTKRILRSLSKNMSPEPDVRSTHATTPAHSHKRHHHPQRRNAGVHCARTYTNEPAKKTFFLKKTHIIYGKMLTFSVKVFFYFRNKVLVSGLWNTEFMKAKGVKFSCKCVQMYIYEEVSMVVSRMVLKWWARKLFFFFPFAFFHLMYDDWCAARRWSLRVVWWLPFFWMVRFSGRAA
jgi:hypothetical protein